jgi:hypothetical protein
MFTTNMDGSASYDKSRLTFTMSCQNPTEGSDPATAAANNCCSLLFSFDGTTLTKNK